MQILRRIGFVFARQWIAGMSVDEAISNSKKINSLDEKVVLNYLGESYNTKKEAEKSLNIYLELLEKMKEKGIKGSVSIKPTQLGMLISDALFIRNCKEIVEKAKKLGYFVWIDMEEYEYVEGTIRTYLKLLQKHKNVGICLQTKLKRSLKDAETIAAHGGIVRIVKGAYAEPDGTFYKSKEDVRNNYLQVMELLLRNSCKIMIATHDDYLIYRAVSAEKRYNARVSFGMLKGIRGKLAKQLVDDGEDFYIYTPFGEEWVKYSMRRIREEGHAILLIRSIFQQ